MPAKLRCLNGGCCGGDDDDVDYDDDDDDDDGDDNRNYDKEGEYCYRGGGETLL